MSIIYAKQKTPFSHPLLVLIDIVQIKMANKRLPFSQITQEDAGDLKRFDYVILTGLI